MDNMNLNIIMIITLVLIILAFLVMYFVKKVKVLQVFNKQPLRFIMVGGVNTLIYYLFFTLLNIYLVYINAHIIAFLLSGTISYFLTTVYTFEKRIEINTFIKFPITYLPNLLFSTIGTEFLVKFHIISQDFASLIMLIIAIPITYAIGKIIYNAKEEKCEK